ncbi:MAG: adenine nucleotide alpha hydrolase family protein [bacterium]|nr:adenine nucleotide alpha hydrolase family protein [bacterium]
MKNKQFIASFEKTVKDTIQKYNLATKKDRIFVACSGGKDSTTVLHILKKLGYKPEALFIDLAIGKYSQKNLENIEKFCKKEKIKLNLISLRDEFGGSVCYIQSRLKTKLNTCNICGLLKRWLLNRKARELKATKLATGHNLDDESQTILMNLVKGNPELCAGLGPKTGVIKDKKFVRRIKPLYFCSEKDIEKYSRIMNFPVVYEPCPCSVTAHRKKFLYMLNDMEKSNPKIKLNIVNHFLEILPEIRKNKKTEKLAYCSICGEPSRKETCRVCTITRVS